MDKAFARLVLFISKIESTENTKQKTLRKIDDGPNPFGSLQKRG